MKVKFEKDFGINCSTIGYKFINETATKDYIISKGCDYINIGWVRGFPTYETKKALIETFNLKNVKLIKKDSGSSVTGNIVTHTIYEADL